MAKFALRARWVVPVETPPIADGVVSVDGEKIFKVGNSAEDGVPVEDLGNVVLLPGLVNAHTHLEFSHLNKPLGRPEMTLPDWVRLVIANRNQQKDSASALAAGWRESLRSGVTSIGDIATSTTRVVTDDPPPQWLAFQEVIGFSSGRVESVFEELQRRLSMPSPPLGWGISPHAPYTVHPALVAKLVALASQRGFPVAMHLAESPEELQLLSDNRGPFRGLLEERSMWDGEIFAVGRTPLDYLRVLAESPRTMVIHGNYLSSSEIEFIAEQRARMSIVFCPRTHAYFGHKTYPLRAMLNAGARVALGTDSRASNPDLSLLSELRQVAATFSDIGPEQILALGSLHGAEALGLSHLVGTLTPGKLANLTAISCSGNERSPLSPVLFGEERPVQTWLRGQQLKWN